MSSGGTGMMDAGVCLYCDGRLVDMVCESCGKECVSQKPNWSGSALKRLKSTDALESEYDQLPMKRLKSTESECDQLPKLKRLYKKVEPAASKPPSTGKAKRPLK